MRLAGGVLPNPAVGARLEGRIQPLSWLAFQVGGAYWLPQSAKMVGTMDTEPRPAIELDMWSGGLRICGLPTDGPWFVEPCVGTELGWMTGRGRNVVSPHQRTDSWWGVLGGTHGGRRLWRIGRTSELRLVLDVEAGAALARPRFGLEGSEFQYRPAVWVWMLGVGMELLAP
jgi:hypothetical protein